MQTQDLILGGHKNSRLFLTVCMAALIGGASVQAGPDAPAVVPQKKAESPKAAAASKPAKTDSKAAPPKSSGAKTEEKSVPVKKVVVTGSRIPQRFRRQGPVADTTFPVIVLDRKDLDRSGAMTVADALRRLPFR